MFQVPVLVTVNRFAADTNEEIRVVLDRCRQLGVRAAVADIHARGGKGGAKLATAVIEEICEGCQLPLTGDVMRMPGLPRKPAYLDIDIDPDGRVRRLS
jgi:formyltetrahydrofolate synthetase